MMRKILLSKRFSMSVVAGIGFLTGVVMMLVAPGVLAQTSTRFYADPSSASLGGAITVVQSTGVGSLGPNSPGRIVSLIIQCFDEKGDVVASAKGDIAKDAKSGSVKVPSNPAGKTIVRCVVYVGYGSGTDQLDITIKTGGGATPPPKPPRPFELFDKNKCPCGSTNHHPPLICSRRKKPVALARPAVAWKPPSSQVPKSAPVPHVFSSAASSRS